MLFRSLSEKSCDLVVGVVVVVVVDLVEEVVAVDLVEVVVVVDLVEVVVADLVEEVAVEGVVEIDPTLLRKAQV